jgi:prokaryotic ubiquitin-like protein Pup
MSEQKHKSSSKNSEEVDEVEVPEPKEFDIDSILDEIDEVLEENAEEFVREYIQKGGE